MRKQLDCKYATVAIYMYVVICYCHLRNFHAKKCLQLKDCFGIERNALACLCVALTGLEKVNAALVLGFTVLCC